MEVPPGCRIKGRGSRMVRWPSLDCLFFSISMLVWFYTTACLDLHINAGSIEDASKERDEAELKVAVGWDESGGCLRRVSLYQGFLALGGSGEYDFDMDCHPSKLDGCRRACVKAGVLLFQGCLVRSKDTLSQRRCTLGRVRYHNGCLRESEHF